VEGKLTTFRSSRTFVSATYKRQPTSENDRLVNLKCGEAPISELVVELIEGHLAFPAIRIGCLESQAFTKEENEYCSMRS
jgi:hypothetical protein